MADIKQLKFTADDFPDKDITSLPNRPTVEGGLSADELKARFDQIGKNELALGNFNKLIDALTATQGTHTGAQNIGALSGDVQTNVQSVLNAKFDKANVVHEPGSSESAVMSQNAVMKAIAQAVSDVDGSGGGVLMTKAEYDSQNSGDGVVNEARLAQNAQKLDGQEAAELSVAHAQNADMLNGQAAAGLSVANAQNAQRLGERDAADYYTNTRVSIPAANFIPIDENVTLRTMNYAFIQNDCLYLRFTINYSGSTWAEGARKALMSITLPAGRKLISTWLTAWGDRASASTGVPCQGWITSGAEIEVAAFNTSLRVPSRIVLGGICPLEP